MSSKLKFDPEKFTTSNELSEDTLRQSNCIVAHCESHMASYSVMAQANAIADLQRHFFNEHRIIPINLEMMKEIISNSKELLSLVANEVAKNDPTPEDITKFIWDNLIVPADCSYELFIAMVELVQQMSRQLLAKSTLGK